MSEQTKKSRVALVKEITEATPVLPSAGTDFLPVHEGYSTELGFEVLESAQLSGSIGKAKGAVGFETPTASLAAYLKHSGTEATAPVSGFSVLLEAAFGKKTVNSTQYDTVAGSTVTAINVDTGEGAFFVVGQALLIKHAAFAWEIAVIKSIAGDVLTPLFALQNAPATGTLLGKAVHYNMPGATDVYPTLTVHDYRGNGAAYAMVAGARVVSATIEAEAGQFITGSFDLEGVAGYWNPIEITATSKYIDFTDDAGTFAAQIAVGVYKSPIELAAAIQTAIDAVTTTTPTVTYSNTTGKFTIKTTGTLLSLLWNTGANTANSAKTKLGFANTDDTGAAATVGYTSDTAVSWASPYSPSFDSSNPLVAKTNNIWIGAQTDNVCVSARSVSYALATPKVDEMNICSASGKSGSAILDRTVTLSAVVNVPKNKADWFDAQVNNTSLSAEWNFGEKSGGNWLVGKSGSLHIKDATMTSHILADADGMVTLEIELTGHVDSSINAETALNLL